MLGIFALAWASLYALAAGAAAFAGEREAGTLRLLDILPAHRRVVWVGKASFALVTTVVLALILLAMAAWSTERWYSGPALTVPKLICYIMVVPLALGWALLWSSLLSNALAAALVALCCAALCQLVLLDAVGDDQSPAYFFLFALAQMAVAAATMAASVAAFTSSRHRPRVRFQLQSPIVITSGRPESAARVRIRPPIAAARQRTLAPVALAERPGARAGEPLARTRRWIEARTLAVQTVKQGWKTWLLVAAIVIVVPAIIYLIESFLDDSWLVAMGGMAVLVMGASVLGLENRDRTHRFLAHHGASPVLVWLVKLAVWAAGLAVLGVIAACTAVFTLSPGGRREVSLAALVLVPYLFTVGLLCGMAFRRGITAVVIGLVLSLALCVPLFVMHTMRLLPVWAHVFVPIALLVVSWAWSGDWMLERPAPGRWVRLALLLCAAFGTLFAGFVGFRVWSIPDAGSIAPPAAWTASAPWRPSAMRPVSTAKRHRGCASRRIRRGSCTAASTCWNRSVSRLPDPNASSSRRHSKTWSIPRTGRRNKRSPDCSACRRKIASAKAT